MGKTRSVKSLSGNKITHFDENGNKISVSIKSISGRQVTHFDANYNKTGTSFRNSSGRMSHYDNDWNKTGYSQVMNPGQTRHYDTHYNKTGESNRNFWGVHETDRQHHSSSGESPSDTAAGCLGMIIVAFLIILFLVFQRFIKGRFPGDQIQIKTSYNVIINHGITLSGGFNYEEFD